MSKRTDRRQLRDTALYVNNWLHLSERIIQAQASAAERALRYSLHFVNGLTVQTLLSDDEFWSIAAELRTLHDEFYRLEMDFDELTDAADLSIVDYNHAMRNRDVKQSFTDLELNVLYAMHRNQHVMLHHKCELPYAYACKVATISDWLADNELPQWVVNADAAIEDVRMLFML